MVFFVYFSGCLVYIQWNWWQGIAASSWLVVFRPADASGHSGRFGVGVTLAGDVVTAQAPWKTPNLKRRPR
jgi:hypothetical protein